MAIDDGFLAQLKKIYPSDVAPIDWSLPPPEHYSDCALLYEEGACNCKPALTDRTSR